MVFDDVYTEGITKITSKDIRCAREMGCEIKLLGVARNVSVMAECPYVRGNASGLAVGLPDGQMGNSEVGHMNIGAGRIIYQDLTSITKAIEDGDFFENEAMLEAMENCKKNNSDLHELSVMTILRALREQRDWIPHSYASQSMMIPSRISW